MPSRENDVNELAQRQILAAAQQILRTAGVTGVIPTPLDEVARAAGIRDVLDIGHLPEELAAKKPPTMRRILGALFTREKTVFIDRTQSDARRRFTEAHEVSHSIIPWQRAPLRLDDEKTLSLATRAQFEIEANLGAAHLLFQGPLAFFERALDFKVSLSAPLALSVEHSTSCHATIRYYVEHHPDPVALIVVGRYEYVDGTLPIWRATQSPVFSARYGALMDRFPTGRLPYGHGTTEPYGPILKSSRLQDVTDTSIELADIGGRRRQFVVEAFYNQRNYFVMLAERRVTRFGRRLNIVSGGECDIAS